MKINSLYSLCLSSLGLLTCNLAFSLPAKAAIACQPGTMNLFPNGSLDRCVLTTKVKLQIYHYKAGSFVFPCKEKEYISFHQKGQLQSCILSETLEIRTGNSVKTCQADSRIDVYLQDDVNSSISCENSWTLRY